MRKIIALALVLTLLFVGCSIPTETPTGITPTPTQSTQVGETDQTFTDMDDLKLIERIEKDVYSSIVNTLDSEEYFVENVEAVYYSKEYLEEYAYNSQSNVFFGYTLAELDEIYSEQRYIFTLGDDGQTTVELFEPYDDTVDKIIKNVAVGTGVIFICVTVSVLTKGVTALSAVNLIFTASAKTASISSLIGGGLGALSAGIVKATETDDINEVLKAAALSGSDGFKWGAISGSLSGGLSQTIALKGATLNGLTMNQAAKIQQESKLPLSFIKSFHSVDEYNIYKTANLTVKSINGKFAFVQDIDWDFVGDISDGRTNAQRVVDGLAPLDSAGVPYELHHIGQKIDSPLAILTKAQHIQGGNNKILHDFTVENGVHSSISAAEWNKQKKEFWSALLKHYEIGQ